MSSYKNFVSTAKMYLNSNGFLRFLLSAHIAVFALGGLFYLLGAFLINIRGGGVIIYDSLVTIGTILLWAGLLLSIFAEDPMTIVIASGAVSVCSLVAWIVSLAALGLFLFSPLFYFLAFGTICIITAIKAEKFVKMRTDAAARSVIPCPRCGAGIPKTAAFCPACGAPNPAMQYAQPPIGQPPYAPPVQPPYAPPVQPPYAPPTQPQYVPPVQPQYVPPVQPPSEAVGEPDASEESAASEEPAVKQCVSCGAELPASAVFCGKCGAKQ